MNINTDEKRKQLREIIRMDADRIMDILSDDELSNPNFDQLVSAKDDF